MSTAIRNRPCFIQVYSSRVLDVGCFSKVARKNRGSSSLQRYSTRTHREQIMAEDCLIDDAQLIESDDYKKIERLTIKEISALAYGVVSFCREERNHKRLMILAVLKRADCEAITRITRACEEKEMHKQMQRQGKKRKRGEDDVPIAVHTAHTTDKQLSKTQEYRRIGRLTVEEIVALVGSAITVGRDERFVKRPLILAVLRRADLATIASLIRASDEKEENIQSRRLGKSRRVSEEKEDEVVPRTARNLDTESAKRRIAYVVNAKGKEKDVYLAMLSEAERNKCYQRYYDVTSNKELATFVCAVCARECRVKEDGKQMLNTNAIPNGQRLKPKRAHPAHDLYLGMLLEPKGVVELAGDTVATVCTSCMRDLEQGDAHTKPPKFSLANELWIGRTPWQLSILTLPEQLLVALLYPRVFVFKLFPKKSSGYNANTLQSALKGTVSSYALNMDDIARMVDGNLLPRPPRILASLIAISFIGVGKLPKAWVLRTFRVRRLVVAEALEWLRVYNPSYYGDISISHEHLNMLPEDGVPEEVTTTIRESEDSALCEIEHRGYVPEEMESNLTNNGGEQITQKEMPFLIIPYRPRCHPS
jgi:hypothetical protein